VTTAGGKTGPTGNLLALKIEFALTKEQSATSVTTVKLPLVIDSSSPSHWYVPSTNQEIYVGKATAASKSNAFLAATKF